MPANHSYILTINGGSSSIKFALFSAQQSTHEPPTHCLIKGKMTGISSSRLHITARLQTSDLGTLEESGIFKRAFLEDHDYSVAERTNASAVTLLLNWINTHIDTELLLAVGHRVVHGGPTYGAPQLITPAMLATLEQWTAIDPEHLPQEIALIKAFIKALPSAQHVACFDTDFHRHLPSVARLLAIPRRYFNKGIRRYGFHGLSYTFVLEELHHLEGLRRAKGRVVMAHLGNGASLAATYQGKSVDTSMGLTPTAGIPMSSRSGDLDPGLYAYLVQTEQMSAKAFQHMVNHESGLLGISETSSDIRELLRCEHDDHRAAEAVELFCYQTKKWICALAGALGGVDTLIFTGGIGENLSTIRARVCAGLEFMGIKLDPHKNNNNAAVISEAGSQVLVMVIPTDEEQIIARHVYQNTHPLDADLLNKMNVYWRAANYLSVGQIYLYANPLLKKPLSSTDVKHRLLGHWGTTPGLNFTYVHLNRIIKQHDLNMIFITGPGHGGPALAANTYLEGTYSEMYPHVTQDEAGLQRLFKQFSFPGGIPSHVAPDIPGSIHEGGELGYSLSHAFGAAFDNPDLIVTCVVGDGEAETGPLATSWHSNKFLNPAKDGAVLPILHLNGYKIANPTFLARIPHAELQSLFIGYGYQPYFVEGDDAETMHQKMAAILDLVLADIHRIQYNARIKDVTERPRWPMIILRSPKGWTGPDQVDGKPIEDTFRSHQVPVSNMENPDHLAILNQWLQSYRPNELFDVDGKLIQKLAELAPSGNRRMGANPHANGGILLQDLAIPDYRQHALNIPVPGSVDAEATRVMGRFLADVMAQNLRNKNFRLFSPDENNSNRWQDVLDVTARTWMAEIIRGDDKLATDGRVMEVLSEHQCQGWLEGYLLTGRHGFLSCYEAFIHIVDSMVNQHAKWLKVANHLPWRRSIASLNYLLSSHVWRQDHNGTSHQDPGFIDHVVNKKAEVIRIYLPPDANTLLSVTDHCLRSRNYINVIVAGKNSQPQWLDIDAAIDHCAAGIGIWKWASTEGDQEPDVVIACAGDVPTIEALATVQLLHVHLPQVKVRLINVVDLMKLQSPSEHPHGLSNDDFDNFFTHDKPVIFAYHGYPALIHRLTYRRNNHQNFHVHGFQEEGTTTTPFDMVVMNKLDRFHLLRGVIERISHYGYDIDHVRKIINDKLREHKRYIEEHGEDMPDIRDWKWKELHR